MTRRTFVKTFAVVAAAVLLPVRRVFRFNSEPALYASEKDERPFLTPRVVQVHRDNACDWQYFKGDYTESIDFDAVKEMLETGLVAFSGSANAASAWKKIIHPYRRGDKIVIKPNINNPRIGYSQAIMTSPQVIRALVESLLGAGYPPEDITIFDLTADKDQTLTQRFAEFGVSTVFLNENRGFLSKIAAKLHLGPDAPDTRAIIRMQKPVRDSAGKDVHCYIPKVLSSSQHLINVPVFKAHQFVLQSSALKNHFGTVRFSNLHSYPVVLHGEDIDWHIADINANPHIRKKTRLTIVDAILGAGCFTRGDNGRMPTRWQTWPKGDTPKSVFFSSDPVALESVLADFISEEQRAMGYEPYSHRYLEIAAELGLGVYERRNPKGEYSRIDFVFRKA